MSGQTYVIQKQIREAVDDYLEQHGMTSLRKIAAAVEERTGIAPSPSTISRLVHEQGYSRPKTSWTLVKK